ncbi:hypothetical protein CBM2626_A220060 [Cupriavidus taiwanensis]|nr:hypothetical protein CBM2626_A220060 [Cupriavidus taiwanensis]
MTQGFALMQPFPTPLQKQTHIFAD